MKLKNIFYGLTSIVLLVLFTACPSTTPETSTEVGITAFRIPNQKGYLDLAAHEFIIKEDPNTSGDSNTPGKNYIIYNTDPLPYGVLSDSLICIVYALGSNPVYMTYSVFDTVELTPILRTFQVTSNVTKVPFFSSPRFTTSTADPNTKKSYLFVFSEETIHPDEVTWNRYKDVLPIDLSGHYTAYSIDSTVFILWGKPNENTGLMSNKLFSSKNGATWQEHSLLNKSYPEGIMHSIGKLNDKIICVSSLSFNNNGEYEANNDIIWSTVDGINWEKEMTGINVGDTAFQSVEKLNGKLYVYGGTAVIPGQKELTKALYTSNPNGAYTITPKGANSIYTFDGNNWTTSSMQLPIEMPSRFASTCYANGRIYNVNGEIAGTSNLTWDVWVTENGTYWLKSGSESTVPAWKSTLVSFSNLIWNVGGIYSNDAIPVIYETVDDGASWFMANEDNRPYMAPPLTFSGRWGHQSIVDAYDRLWIIGGNTGSRSTVQPTLNEVWIAQKAILK